MRSSTHANNKTRSILVLGKDFIQGIDDKKFCLSLHYNGDSSYLFVKGTDIINFKAKDSGTVLYPLFVGGLSNDFSLANAHRTGLYGYIYDLKC